MLRIMGGVGGRCDGGSAKKSFPSRLYKAQGSADNAMNYSGTASPPMPHQVNQPLPAGYVLNGYRIEKPLSSGGFSIVYLARDESGTPFAIKEYLPSSLALRSEGVEVRITDESNL
ncbi:MAG: hypothetical protein ACRD3R_10035, partial [Terriglobales bacterium]